MFADSIAQRSIAGIVRRRNVDENLQRLRLAYPLWRASGALQGQSVAGGPGGSITVPGVHASAGGSSSGSVFRSADAQP